MDLDKIITGDSILEMKKLPDKSFDFCFADPPYFMQIEENKKLYRVDGSEFDGCDDYWDKFASLDEYKDWTRCWLKEVQRVLKDNGTVCVISGMQSVYEIGNILRELGFWVINDIIWQKSNPTPNFGGTRLNNSHETLIIASKSKKAKFTFNYKTGKFLNGGKQMGSVWNFPVCSGNERLKDENNKKVHTTQKPIALLYRLIVLFTKLGDAVLDPFGGTMTTAVVAKQTGRKFLMIERDEKYVKYGKERIASVIPEIGDVEKATFDIKPLKITVPEMVSKGYLKLGETFFHKNGEKAVLVSDSGKLSYHGNTDSMHEIAGQMANSKRRINAFDNLYVERNDELVLLSEVRNNYRKSLIG